MGILDLFRSEGRRSSSAPRAEAGTIYTGDLDDPRISEFLRGGVSTESGAYINPDNALKVATAYRCVGIISSAVKTVPIDLKRRVDAGRRVDASDHPLWIVLRKRPNGWQTPSEFKQFMQLCVLHRGNAYARIVRGTRRRVKALIPLHPNRVEATQNNDLSMSYRYTRKDGAIFNFQQDDILHLRGMSSDGIVGTSVINYARESLGLSVQTEKHAAKLFENGVSLGGILTHPKRLTDPVIARLKASMEDFRGAKNAHKLLVTEEDMKYERIDMSAVDSQFIQSREFTQLEVAMFYGVPPHMLGLTQKTTSWGSGIEQQSIGFVTYTLQDWFTMWSESLERDCLRDDDDALYIRLNPAGLIRGDIKTRFGAYAVARQWGWMSVNDVRALEDQDPVEGGDEYLSPLNMAPIGHNGGPPLDDPEDGDAEDDQSA